MEQVGGGVVERRSLVHLGGLLGGDLVLGGGDVEFQLEHIGDGGNDRAGHGERQAQRRGGLAGVVVGDALQEAVIERERGGAGDKGGPADGEREHGGGIGGADQVLAGFLAGGPQFVFHLQHIGQQGAIKHAVRLARRVGAQIRGGGPGDGLVAEGHAELDRAFGEGLGVVADVIFVKKSGDLRVGPLHIGVLGGVKVNLKPARQVFAAGGPFFVFQEFHNAVRFQHHGPHVREAGGEAGGETGGKGGGGLGQLGDDLDGLVGVAGVDGLDEVVRGVDVEAEHVGRDFVVLEFQRVEVVGVGADDGIDGDQIGLPVGIQPGVHGEIRDGLAEVAGDGNGGIRIGLEDDRRGGAGIADPGHIGVEVGGIRVGHIGQDGGEVQLDHRQAIGLAGDGVLRSVSSLTWTDLTAGETQLVARMAASRGTAMSRGFFMVVFMMVFMVGRLWVVDGRSWGGVRVPSLGCFLLLERLAEIKEAAGRTRHLKSSRVCYTCYQ